MADTPANAAAALESDPSARDRVVAAADELVVAVRKALGDARCRLWWDEPRYARVLSLAALSHEVVYLEEIARAAHDERNSFVVGLLARHHLETWATGMYLLLGGNKALEEFIGQARLVRRTQRGNLEELRSRGQYDGDSLAEEPQLADWEEKRGWSYEQVIKAVVKLARNKGVLKRGDALYDTAYRSLSNRLGAHPAFELLEKYIDTGSALAPAMAEPAGDPYRIRPLMFASILTALHAQAAFKERGLDVQWFDRVLANLGAALRG